MGSAKIPTCSGCGGDEVAMVLSNVHGWVCMVCITEFERLDRQTDWDQYEEKKRRRIQEANEY